MKKLFDVGDGPVDQTVGGVDYVVNDGLFLFSGMLEGAAQFGMWKYDLLMVCIGDAQ